MYDKTVLIVCEYGEGQSDSGNARLIDHGRRLAAATGGDLVCLLAGAEAAHYATVIGGHVDKVYVAEFSTAAYNSVDHKAALRALIKKYDPRAVLFAHTFIGMDLAAELSARTGCMALTNCSRIDPADTGIRVERSTYRGKLNAAMVNETTPLIATVQTGGDPVQPCDTPSIIETLDYYVAADGFCEHLSVRMPDSSQIDISKFEVLVSGGRGIGDRENFALVEDLAKAIGGEISCSRPLVDMGWFDVTRQVGLSGKSVKPRLYVACGISGANEHLHGMKDAANIVAINSDPEAPIFRVAHYGIVGDLNEVLPALTAKLGG